MHRPRFLPSLLQATAGCAGAGLATPPSVFGESKRHQRPRVAVTMDDPNVNLGAYMRWPEANQRILDALRERRLKAALFVCGMRVDEADGKSCFKNGTTQVT